MSNIKEFTAQIVETVNEIIKDNKITEPIQVQSLQMMGNGIFLCLKEALADKQRGAVLNEQITLPWKSAKRLLNFCFDKAKERAPKNSGGYGYAPVPVYVDSNMITDWIFEYYALDDKAQIEEEERKAEEARLAAEEKARKKAEAAAKKKEKLEKDIKKAETLIEKEFAFGYKLTEKDIKFFEKLQKEGVVSKNSEGKWFVKDIDDTSEEESEEFDDEEDLDFVDEE